MGLFSKKNKPAIPKLRPNQKLFLILWTLFVVFLTFRLFRGAGGRVLMGALVVVPVTAGVLLGLRILDKFEALAKAFGFEPKPPPDPSTDPKKHFDAFLGFLKSHRSKGQFTRTELSNFCRERNISPDSLIILGKNKGWFQEMGGAMVITSQGEEMLGKFS